MLSEYEAERIQYDLMKGVDTSPRPVLRLVAALLIVAGLGLLGGYDWGDSGAPVVPQARAQR